MNFTLLLLLLLLLLLMLLLLLLLLLLLGLLEDDRISNNLCNLVKRHIGFDLRRRLHRLLAELPRLPRGREGGREGVTHDGV